MAVTNYFTCDGRIRSQSTTNDHTHYTDTFFTIDAVGSVLSTVNSSKQVINTYRYKPYGDLLSKTGTGADPRFLWTGDTGSRTTGLASASQYNRARHYDTKSGRWTTVDPLFPSESAYGYVNGNPANWIDPSGEKCCNYHPGSNPTFDFIPAYGCSAIHWDYGYTTFDSSCAAAISALGKCGISPRVACKVIDGADCVGAATKFGVSPAILCGAMINEASKAGWTNDVQDFFAAGGNALGGGYMHFADPKWVSSGLIQMQPRHAKECLDRLAKCNPSLSNTITRPPNFPRGWLGKIATDPKWSMQVAAACMYVETHSECGGKRTPNEFPVSWNPRAFKKPTEYSKKSKCAVDAMKRSYI